MSVKGINIVPDKQGVIINLYVCVCSVMSNSLQPHGL